MLCALMPEDLSDLKEVFNQLQRKRLGERFTDRDSPDRILDNWAQNADFKDWEQLAIGNGEDQNLYVKMVKAAKVYVIARDEGRAAAILWKLRNG